MNMMMCVNNFIDYGVDDHYDGFFIDCFTKSRTSVTVSETFAELNVLQAGSNTTVNNKLDTGSQVNVLPINVFRRMQVSCRLRLALNLIGYGGRQLKSVGVVSLNIDCKIQRVQTDFHDIDPQGNYAPPILGLPSCLYFITIMYKRCKWRI